MKKSVFYINNGVPINIKFSSDLTLVNDVEDPRKSYTGKGILLEITYHPVHGKWRTFQPIPGNTIDQIAVYESEVDQNLVEIEEIIKD